MGIGSPLSPNFRNEECRWEEGLSYLDVFHLDRDKKVPPLRGDALRGSSHLVGWS